MEVKVTKCQNGHYFDLNKHEICPHCGAMEFTANVEQTQKSGFALFKKKEKAEDRAVESKKSKSFAPKEAARIKIEEVVPTDSQQAFVIEDVVTEGAFSLEDGSPLIEDVETEGFFSKEAKPALEDALVTKDIPIVDNSSATDDENTAGFFSQDPISAAPPVSTETTLLEEIQRVTADSDVKTVGFFSINNDNDINNTSNKRPQIQEPMVGWLVCIGGKYIGNDFKIVVGKNSIGRNKSNNISLDGDDSVSREKHAWIIYEPRKREFFIKPGESSGLTYLNNENIFDAQTLNKGDILEFGNSKFIFIPLCGEEFSWNDYIGKE